MEGGEGEDVLNLDDDFDAKGEPNYEDEEGDSEEADSNNDEDEMVPDKKGSAQKPAATGVKPDVKGDKLDN
jgi:hypothetical protein